MGRPGCTVEGSFARLAPGETKEVVESEHQTECSSFGAREYVDVWESRYLLFRVQMRDTCILHLCCVKYLPTQAKGIYLIKTHHQTSNDQFQAIKRSVQWILSAILDIACIHRWSQGSSERRWTQALELNAERAMRMGALDTAHGCPGYSWTLGVLLFEAKLCSFS